VLCEEHLGDLVPRLKDFGADLTQIYSLEAAPDPRDRFRELEAAATEVRPSVIILDTLASFAEGLVKDPNSSSEYGQVVNRLTRLSRASKAGVLLLAHARKSDGTYRDSSAIGGGVDVLIEIAVAEGQEPTIRKLNPKARWRVQPCQIRLVGQSYQLMDGELTLDTRVAQFVQDNPGSGSTKIRANVSGRASDVDAAIQRLLDSGHFIDDGDRHRGHHYRYRTQPMTGTGGLSEPSSLSDNAETGPGTDALSQNQTLGSENGTALAYEELERSAIQDEDEAAGDVIEFPGCDPTT
jgi:AAA domain-containing protein